MGFPKRCLEFFVQVAAMVASGGALVAAIFTEIKFKELNSIQRNSIQTESNVRGQNELFLKTEATAGLVFATTGVLVLIGFIALLGRLFNTKHEQSSRRIFTCLYVLFVAVCFLGFAAAGILGVFTSLDWSEIESGFVNDILSIFDITVVENIRNSVAATAGCSLLAAVLFLLLEAVVLFCCAAVKDY